MCLHLFYFVFLLQKDQEIKRESSAAFLLEFLYCVAFRITKRLQTNYKRILPFNNMIHTKRSSETREYIESR